MSDISKIFYPYIFFLASFSGYLNIMYEYREENALMQTINLVWQGILVAVSVYFLKNELSQLYNDGLEYLYSMWNYIDLIPPILILIIVFCDHFGGFGIDTDRSIQAIATFFMWMKFLYFLRIFKSTGYLIQMIIEVVYDMRVFMVILLVTIVAFSDAFLSISLGN